MTNYPNVDLTNPVITQPQVTASYYKITDVTDNPLDKTVVARVVVGENGINFFSVWSGASYDAIGQWTDTDLVNAVTPMVESTYPPVN
jgi:hypothetical protein